MALRNLVLEGDPLLRKTSRPVEEITPRIIKLLDDMADTMYYGGRGIGIAAPQVGVLRRVFIVDVGDEHGLIEFINPEILEVSGSQTDNEGCLSVPGKTCEVERPSHIKVKAMDRNGKDWGGVCIITNIHPSGESVISHASEANSYTIKKSN